MSLFEKNKIFKDMISDLIAKFKKRESSKDENVRLKAKLSKEKIKIEKGEDEVKVLKDEVLAMKLKDTKNSVVKKFLLLVALVTRVV